MALFDFGCGGGCNFPGRPVHKSFYRLAPPILEHQAIFVVLPVGVEGQGFVHPGGDVLRFSTVELVSNLLALRGGFRNLFQGDLFAALGKPAGSAHPLSFPGACRQGCRGDAAIGLGLVRKLAIIDIPAGEVAVVAEGEGDAGSCRGQVHVAGWNPVQGPFPVVAAVGLEQSRVVVDFLHLRGADAGALGQAQNLQGLCSFVGHKPDSIGPTVGQVEVFALQQCVSIFVRADQAHIQAPLRGGRVAVQVRQGHFPILTSPVGARLGCPYHEDIGFLVVDIELLAHTQTCQHGIQFCLVGVRLDLGVIFVVLQGRLVRFLKLVQELNPAASVCLVVDGQLDAGRQGRARIDGDELKIGDVYIICCRIEVQRNALFLDGRDALLRGLPGLVVLALLDIGHGYLIVVLGAVFPVAQAVIGAGGDAQNDAGLHSDAQTGVGIEGLVGGRIVLIGHGENLVADRNALGARLAAGDGEVVLPGDRAILRDGPGDIFSTLGQGPVQLLLVQAQNRLAVGVLQGDGDGFALRLVDLQGLVRLRNGDFQIGGDNHRELGGVLVILLCLHHHGARAAGPDGDGHGPGIAAVKGVAAPLGCHLKGRFLAFGNWIVAGLGIIREAQAVGTGGTAAGDVDPFKLEGLFGDVSHGGGLRGVLALRLGGGFGRLGLHRGLPCSIRLGRWFRLVQQHNAALVFQVPVRCLPIRVRGSQILGVLLRLGKVSRGHFLDHHGLLRYPVRQQINGAALLRPVQAQLGPRAVVNVDGRPIQGGLGQNRGEGIVQLQIPQVRVRARVAVLAGDRRAGFGVLGCYGFGNSQPCAHFLFHLLIVQIGAAVVVQLNSALIPVLQSPVQIQAIIRGRLFSIQILIVVRLGDAAFQGIAIGNDNIVIRNSTKILLHFAVGGNGLAALDSTFLVAASSGQLHIAIAVRYLGRVLCVANDDRQRSAAAHTNTANDAAQPDACAVTESLRLNC